MFWYLLGFALGIELCFGLGVRKVRRLRTGSSDRERTSSSQAVFISCSHKESNQVMVRNVPLKRRKEIATTPRVRPAVAKQACLDPPSHLLSSLLSRIVATDTQKLYAPHYGAGVLRN